MTLFFLILIFFYVVLGVSRIISDFNQPSINQPHYVRHPSITSIFIAFLFAPFFWWTEVTRPMSKESKLKNKEFKELEKKHTKMMRNLFRK